ncbi:MAG: hypothetical protein HY961_02435, partial [Ignavibacteriae bacterium]|nr:hypothetical protein [Ignavibacteriota bacterium]
MNYARWFLTAALFFGLSVSLAQSSWRTPAPMAFVDVTAPADGDDEKDPGFSTYKAGYNLVLEDKWKEAMEKFAELKTKFPNSAYVDDAAYWSAY